MSNKEGEEFEVEVAHLIYLEGTVWLCGVSGNAGELRLNLVTPLKTKMDSKNDGFYWDEHAAIDARNPAQFTTELLPFLP